MTERGAVRFRVRGCGHHGVIAAVRGDGDSLGAAVSLLYQTRVGIGLRFVCVVAALLSTKAHPAIASTSR